MTNFHFRHRIISSLGDIDIPGIRKIAHYFPRLLIPAPKQKLVIKTLYGFQLHIDPLNDTGVERSLYYTGTYEKGTLHVMKHLLKEGDVFVDVGANIGLMSIYASQLIKDRGKVIAFEPNTDTRRILEENIKLNGNRNIEISSYAIGHTKSQGKLYESNDRNRGGATLVKPDIDVEAQDVEMIRLKDHPGIPDTLKLVKLDIEGFELEALKGAVNILKCDSPPMLIIECSENRVNSGHGSPADLFEFVKSINDYRIFRSQGGKERISQLIEITGASKMPDHDNIYCFTEQHLKDLPKKLFKYV